ncbi:hypothetical protein [Actinophytocola sp.]|uniref:hypothetical protein n=1 Tax=Actinophytocola sp. TaxID=1872138 RepID=UPI002D7E703C|nr:hypothetical protein [Actinophytocola sp.]HET9139037.1 hypothetical protein [Actinophytocola sp.]
MVEPAGEGCEPDLRQAAERGDVDAMVRLGRLACARGEVDQARRWWTFAAAAGHVESMFLLSRLAAQAGDQEQWMLWTTQAAAAGHPEAQRIARELDGPGPDPLRPG